MLSSHAQRNQTEKFVVGYTLRDAMGEITYIGISNNAERRATQHRKSKIGKMKVETPPVPRWLARKWESKALDSYRRLHGGKNPPFNRTKHG